MVGIVQIHRHGFEPADGLALGQVGVGDFARLAPNRRHREPGQAEYRTTHDHLPNSLPDPRGSSGRLSFLDAFAVDELQLVGPLTAGRNLVRMLYFAPNTNPLFIEAVSALNQVMEQV
jgi:hypothetical protein